MESLDNIISRYAKPEHPELEAVKRYVDKQYHIAVQAAINGETIVITVPSAALANTLRLQVAAIRTECQIEKRLIFRIG